MDHYADAQMHVPEDRGRGARLVLKDDSMHGFNMGTNQEVQVPIMSAEESQRYAQQWQNRVGSVTQVMWFEIAGRPEDGQSCPTVGQVLKTWGSTLFPFMTWVRLLDAEALRADIVAGLTVGVMVIPQSMSYANIAGLDFKYGMYSALVPLMVYAFTGTSRQLAVGPVAMISLLVEVGLNGQLTDEECPAFANRTDASLQQYDVCPGAYAELAFLTSFLVGIFQLGAGILRLGFIVSFLAHPVVSGFTSGAAIIIGLSQVQYFLDFKIPKSQYVHETLESIFKDIDETNYVTLILGLGWWFMLWCSRKAAAKYKKLSFLRPCAPLIVCVLAIFITANWQYFGGCNFEVCGEAKDRIYTGSGSGSGSEGNDSSNRVVGYIESGFPNFTGNFDFGKLSRVLSTAISASLIGYMESISIAKSLAAKHQYEINPGQELYALGFANIAGSLFSCYPVTGSFSRSAVNNMVGAKTNLAGFITSLLMLLTLLVLTDYFYFLPKYCLAAIVISSVTSLVDYNEAKYLWRVKRTDFFLWIFAFLGTLLIGVQWGILLAVGVSIAVVIYESVRPQMVVLWRLPGTPIYRNIKQDSIGHFVPGVLCVRVGSSMYFANVAYIRDKLRELTSSFYVVQGEAEGQTTSSHPVRYIVVECTAVISIDSTALHMLESLHREFKERGIYVSFACVGNRVERVLRAGGLVEKIGERWIHPSVHEAVSYCVRHRMLKASNTDGAEEESNETKPMGSPDPLLPGQTSPVSPRSPVSAQRKLQLDAAASEAGYVPSPLGIETPVKENLETPVEENPLFFFPMHGGKGDVGTKKGGGEDADDEPKSARLRI